MHQDLLQLQACQNPSDDPETQVLEIMIFWDHLDWCLGACWPKLPIFREHFWATILSLDRNDINNLGPKGHPFKTIFIREERLQLGRPCMACIIAQSRQIVRMKKRKKNNKRKIDCHVIHLKNSIESKQEKRKMMKNCINTNHFPCKESLFSLGSYVRDDKWPSFITFLL